MPFPFITSFRFRHFRSTAPFILLCLLLFTPSEPAVAEETAEPAVAEETAEPAVAEETAEPLDGVSLYALHCASCHRPLGKTSLYVHSLSRIRSAIDHLAVMNELRKLADAEVRAIAGALAVELAEAPQ